ncbi:MAG: hypothetical protein AAGA43_13480 [Bacteroidota bacterium]
MNISILIQQLESLKHDHGPNIEVKFADSPYSNSDIAGSYFEPNDNIAIIH